MFMHCLPSTPSVPKQMTEFCTEVGIKLSHLFQNGGSMILLYNHLSCSNLEALLSLYTIIRYNYLQLIHTNQCWNASVNSSWRLAVHGGKREHRRHALLPLLPAFLLDSSTHHAGSSLPPPCSGLASSASAFRQLPEIELHVQHNHRKKHQQHYCLCLISAVNMLSEFCNDVN